MSLTSPGIEELKATLVAAHFGATQLERDMALSVLRQHAIQAAATEQLLAKVESVPLRLVMENDFPERGE